jgi:glycine/D-amino acid oxidase-like deaminating enzyme
MPGPDPSNPNPEGRGADVAIIGDGVIGLSTALELARRGATCCLIGAQHDGAASSAAAGLLAPTIGQLPPAARPLFVASLEQYPEFLESLREFDRGLSMLTGLLEIFHESPAYSPDASLQALRTTDVEQLEPSLSAPFGGVLHPLDGAVDNVRLVRALRAAVMSHPSVRFISDNPAVAVAATDRSPAVGLRDGSRVDARKVVVAAGAWSPIIRGLPRRLPVSPLKGQMLALEAVGLRHAVMAPDVYLVPREREILIGATSEHAGFDTTTSAEAINGLRAAAERLYPGLSSAKVVRAWAGIRPATPDMLPIIGNDPNAPQILYACGHSKNGILLAPATAKAIAALAQGGDPEWDLSAFSISRFATPSELGTNHR